MQNKVLELPHHKSQGVDNNRLLEVGGRLDLGLVARMEIDVEVVGRDSTSVEKGMPLNAGSALDGENLDETNANVENEVVAADPAALKGDDAIDPHFLLSVDILSTIDSVQECDTEKQQKWQSNSRAVGVTACQQRFV